MEASEKEMVSREDEEVSGFSRRIIECLIRHRTDTHMTLERVSAETGHDVRGTGPAMASLKRRGMVLERRDEGMGESYFRVPEGTIESYPLLCKVPGCEFLAKSEAGLAIHNGRVHKTVQTAAQPLVEVHDVEEEDEEPEVLEQAAPDVAEVLKAFEHGANEIRRMGWQVDLQIRLSFPPLPKLGAS